MNYTSDLFDLSGPARIRASFGQAHKISLVQAGGPLDLTYSRLFRRVKEGTIALKVRKDEQGRMFVLVEDLITYLYGSDSKDSVSESKTPTTTKRGPGRPRKSTTENV